MRNLPGSTITILEAIKKSMIVPISDIKEVKYHNPHIVKGYSIKDAIEPGQFIVDICYLKQKYNVVKILSGKIEKQFECDYKILINNNEKPIPEGRTLLLILADDKAEGKYHLIKALEDNEQNQREIIKSIKELSYLINW